ncbi:MAG: amidohydrolase family protein [Terriglobales bacterium]
MSNSKTTPSSPSKPRVYNGWVRKFELDDYLDRHLPVPTQVVSNEEYFPLPQTRQQQAVEHRALELADRNSKRLGMSRRQFLQTSCGMAVSFAAMNSVFGEFFTVNAAELLEPAAAQEKKTKFFIFDVQTHHVGTGQQIPSASKELLDFVLGLRKSLGAADPALSGREVKIEDLQLENFIKELFLDSETDVVALSALPTATEAGAVLPPHVIAHSRKVVNELADSRRLVSHGLFSPDLSARNLEWMQEQAERLKIDAWKGYTGQPMVEGAQGWWLDDEKRTYPALEYSRKMKIKNICLHKGLPLFFHEAEYYSPADVVKASKDFPDLNFLLYHSGFKSLQDVKPAVDSGLKQTSYIPWVSDLCDWRRKNLHMTNVYMELGSTFALMTVTSPLLCAHVLGMILDAFGADHVLWGTDSIFWGSPQWQIEAFRRLQMPDELIKRFGYAPLTDEVKAKVFGRNAARVYGVDIGKRRKAIPSDYLERLQKLYQQGSLPSPSNTQYGWVHA